MSEQDPDEARIEKVLHLLVADDKAAEAAARLDGSYWEPFPEVSGFALEAIARGWDVNRVLGETDGQLRARMRLVAGILNRGSP